MIVKYIFNGTTEMNPVNRMGNFIQLNFDQQSVINQVAPMVGIKNLYFGREDVKTIMDYITINGVFYAPTFDIEITHKINNVWQTQTVNCYIDLTEGFKTSKDGTQVSIKLYSGIDWLEDVIDGFTFESLYLGGSSLITQADFDSKFVYIPYIISRIPNYGDAVMAMIGIFSMTANVQNMVLIIKDDVNLTAKVIFQLIAVILEWASLVDIPAAIVDTAELAWNLLTLVLRILYLLLVVAAYILLIEQLLQSLIQQIKYHAGMLLSDLLKITCQQLGLTFQSSIWDAEPFNQLVYIPSKYQPPPVPDLFTHFGVQGYISPSTDQKGYMMGTGGDLLRLCKGMINGKIISKDGNLILERRDFNASLPSYHLPDVRKDWNGFNTNEFIANLLIKFQSDLNDKNTIDNYGGQVFQSSTMPNNAPNPLLVCTKGEKTIEISASRGINKTQLTIVENILNDFFSAINTISSDLLNVFGQVTLLSNRVNCMLLENDMIDVPKIVLIEPNGNPYNNTGVRLRWDNLAIVNAGYLWDKFYCIDSWKPLLSSDSMTGYGISSNDYGKHNQYFLYTPELNKPGDKNKVPFSFENFMDFISNNKFIATFADGDHEVIADSIDWYFEADYADMLFRENKIYDTNLLIIKSLPNGQ